MFVPFPGTASVVLQLLLRWKVGWIWALAFENPNSYWEKPVIIQKTGKERTFGGGKDGESVAKLQHLLPRLKEGFVATSTMKLK